MLPTVLPGGVPGPCRGPTGPSLRQQHLTAGLEDVEGDEARRQLGGEPHSGTPARGGPALQGLERQPPAFPSDDQLAVQDQAAGQELFGGRHEIREPVLDQRAAPGLHQHWLWRVRGPPTHARAVRVLPSLSRVSSMTIGGDRRRSARGRRRQAGSRQSPVRGCVSCFRWLPHASGHGAAGRTTTVRRAVRSAAVRAKRGREYSVGVGGAHSAGRHRSGSRPPSPRRFTGSRRTPEPPAPPTIRARPAVLGDGGQAAPCAHLPARRGGALGRGTGQFSAASSRAGGVPPTGRGAR